MEEEEEEEEVTGAAAAAAGAGAPAGGRRPLVTSFQPRAPQELVLFSLFNSGESAFRRFLPKSHLSKVIIHDNTSVQRVQEIKLKHIEDSKRKVGSMFDQMKKKFVHDQQKKLDRWRKEYSRYQTMLEQMDQRALAKQADLSIVLLEAQKSSFIEWEQKQAQKQEAPE